MRDLLSELTTLLDQGRDCVYCAVIETRGSTPQKPGAAMLVFPDGSQRGTLGGGCVEAEVRRRALQTLDAGRAEIHTFTLDHDYGWDDGLICGGRMSILVDPLTQSSLSERRQNAADYYRHYRRLIEQGVGCTEVVALSDQGADLKAGTRFLFDAENQPVAQLPATPIPEEVFRHLIPLRQRPRPTVHHGFVYVPVQPRITLLIVGGGHIGQAVARLASEVDFDVWVLDDRERFASRERFPTAQRLFVGDIGDTLKELARSSINPSTYAIIVTRGHVHDEVALYHLARTSAGYVGMIGSKRKIKTIYEDLVAKGIPEEALARVRAPIGFDIGSQTVPEIAVSIVAELIASRNLKK